MSFNGGYESVERFDSDLSQRDVLLAVQKSTDRIIENLENEVGEDADVDFDFYKRLLIQNDHRAFQKAYKQAEEDAIAGSFKQAFITSLKNALDDPAGWLQVLITLGIGL